MENNEVKTIVRDRTAQHLESVGKFRVQLEIPLPLLERINRIATAERRNRNAQIIDFLYEIVGGYEKMEGLKSDDH